MGAHRRVLLRQRPVVLGADSSCDVVVERAAPRHAVAWAEGGRVVVSELGASERITLDGRAVVGRGQAGPGALLGLGEASFVELLLAETQERPFVVRVRTQPELGIRLERLGDDGVLELTEGRTAELAYLLARQSVLDEARGLDEDQVGWVDDMRLAARLWGVRGHLTSANENSLNVCVYRLRTQLEMAGFSRDLIEKRQRRTRFRPELVGAMGLAG